mmetsp:Transcript_5590/g.15612  ORF Transcript_5590/g.15612 Transcript_5590/m.15612 type:complete len:271 (+) Transcript_5590:1003-1815(+)
MLKSSTGGMEKSTRSFAFRKASMDSVVVAASSRRATQRSRIFRARASAASVDCARSNAESSSSCASLVWSCVLLVVASSSWSGNEAISKLRVMAAARACARRFSIPMWCSLIFFAAAGSSVSMAPSSSSLEAWPRYSSMRKRLASSMHCRSSAVQQNADWTRRVASRTEATSTSFEASSCRCSRPRSSSAAAVYATFQRTVVAYSKSSRVPSASRGVPESACLSEFSAALSAVLSAVFSGVRSRMVCPRNTQHSWTISNVVRSVSGLPLR